MKRRKAIISFITLGVGVGAFYSGYRVFNWYKTPDWKFLMSSESIISELAEIIIPRTDTPGAKDVQAATTIMHLIKNCTRRVEQNTFIEGLKEVVACSNRNFQKPFNNLNDSERYQILHSFMKAGQDASGIIGKAKRKLAGRSFFDILKSYTVIAYCTSEKGATEGLAFSYIPSQYNGCVELKQQPKAWATK